MYICKFIYIYIYIYIYIHANIIYMHLYNLKKNPWPVYRIMELSILEVNSYK